MKKKKIASDFVYTFLGLVIMNITLQVLIYPLINKKYGASYLGDIVYYTGLVYILSASIGNACANQRLLSRKKFKTSNIDYLTIILLFSVLIFVVYTVVMSVNKSFSINALLYGLSAVCIFVRYYSEVEFRLTANFKGYLIYYIILSIGYLFGYLLFVIVKEWSLIFIVGEGCAIVYVVIFGNIYHLDKRTENFNKLNNLIVVLALSYVLIFVVSQYYKFFLKIYIGSESVTKYYVTSFFGKSLDMVITPISTLIMSYLTKGTGFLNTKKFKQIILIVCCAGLVLYLGFIVATPIYTRIFYKEIYNDVLSINLVVNFAQSMCAMASILAVFTLTEIGSKKHFGIQLLYAVVYVVATSVMTKYYGLLGFGIGASIAYTIRFVITAVVGREHLLKKQTF